MEQLFEKILVIYDSDPVNNPVIKKAATIARNQNAQLIIGHVVSVPSNSATRMYIKDMYVNEKQAAEEELAPVLEELAADKDIASVETKIVGGDDIAHTIIEDIVEEVQPDLIVCGSRGYGELHYTFVGSVSKKIIHKSPCDVLVVKDLEGKKKKQ